MSKAVYLKGSRALSEDERMEFTGCRFENADAFQGVSSGIKLAIVIGDYPEIVEALKVAKVKVEIREDDAPKAKAKGSDSKAKETKQTAPKAEPAGADAVADEPAGSNEPDESVDESSNIEKLVEHFKAQELTTKPTGVKALEEETGLDTNGKEIDEAWLIHKAAS